MPSGTLPSKLRFETVLFLLFAIPTIFSCNSAGTVTGNSSTKLRNAITSILQKHKATVGISAMVIETGDTFSIRGQEPFGMQSVYKFPLALAVLHAVEKGDLTLNKQVYLPDSLLQRFHWSPLKKQNPGKNLHMSVDSLIMYMMRYSDNLSCDALFNFIGGTSIVEAFIHQKGFQDIKIKYTEQEVGDKPSRMFENTSTPVAMTGLLKAFFENKMIPKKRVDYLLNYMTNDSTSHKRILGELPTGTRMAHKTGTGATSDTFIEVCNDVGIIYLPNGKHLALTVFVNNATMSYPETEKLIAAISKEIFKFYQK